MTKTNDELMKLVTFYAPVADIAEFDEVARARRVSRSDLLRGCVVKTNSGAFNDTTARH